MVKTTTKLKANKKETAQPKKGIALKRLLSLKGYRPSKRTYLAILILGILALFFYNKSWFVAATVNGQPITAIELNQKLRQNFKTQTLNQMINEKIIEQEASKQGVAVSVDELNGKIAELEQSYGGKEAFDMLLSQQGVTRDEFLKQLRLQLVLEKIYSKEIQPTEDEVKKFLDENQSLPEATDEAKFRQLAENQLKQQKLSDTVSLKFQELRSQANIQIF